MPDSGSHPVGGDPTLAQWVEHVRSTHAQWMAAVPPTPVDQVAELTVAGRPARLYRPAGAGPLPVLVYLHGGGWVMGDITCYDGVARALAVACGAVVVSVDYRRSPEHRHPAALQDTVGALRWVADHGAELGVDVTRIGVAGDSAGGQLAAAAALRLAADRDLVLAVQVMIYAALDLRDRPSYPEMLTRVLGLYLGEQDRTAAEVSPLLAPDLTGLPPAVIATAEHDVLRGQAEEYAARLAEAGVPAALLTGTGLHHGFLGQLGSLPAAADFVTRIGAHVRSAMEAVPDTGSRTG